jgi:hypothetical protein
VVLLSEIDVIQDKANVKNQQRCSADARLWNPEPPPIR